MSDRATAERRLERREYARVEAFSDGVFAIAITLLVLGIEVPQVAPDQLGDAISDLGRSILSYFIGFAVIGAFWLGHHRFFATLHRFDAGLVWANTAYLSLISLLPFTTALLGDYDEAAAVALFAANVGVAATGSLLMTLLATKRGLAEPAPPTQLRSQLAHLAVLPTVFFASIPVAYIDQAAGKWCWLLVIPASRLTARRARG